MQRLRVKMSCGDVDRSCCEDDIAASLCYWSRTCDRRPDVRGDVMCRFSCGFRWEFSREMRLRLRPDFRFRLMFRLNSAVKRLVRMRVSAGFRPDLSGGLCPEV